MRITTVSRIAGATLAAGIFVIVGSGWLVLQELRVNGPIYQRIASGKDLIASVVPPSAYIIEAFLEATVMVKEPWTFEPGRKRLKALREDYEDRHRFWSNEKMAPALRNQLVKAAHEPAYQFWQTVEAAFLPAMARGDADAASDAYLQMAEAFRSHRGAIDEVVRLARQQNSELEHAAAAREHTILTRIFALTAFVVALITACMLGANAWVVGAIVRMQHAMRKLAGGDLDTAVPCLDRTDEIGQMAGAVQVFHDNAVARNKLNREARLLSELNEWLQSCKSLDELYRMVGEFVSRLLPGCAGTLYIYANSRDVLETARVWNGAQSTTAIQPDDCWGLRRGRTYIYGESEVGFPCAHVTADNAGDYCCIPILAHGETIGMLHLTFACCHAPETDMGVAQSRSEQRRLGLVCAEQISLAIANVKLRDQLRDQSIRDTLTGMFNRRYMLETCRREFARAARTGQSVSVLSIDVDHFKKFNDNHGHDAGDTVLRAVADVMKTSFRDEDVPCRFGGEEFVVLLPGATAAIAVKKAEELRSKVEALVVRYVDGNLPRVSISVGVAAFPYSGDNPQAVLKAADEALYRAKDGGRNCVKVSTMDEVSAVPVAQVLAMQRTLAAKFPAPQREEVGASIG
jgi:diguanylate cyclase (GGDEF)-like protein